MIGVLVVELEPRHTSDRASHSRLSEVRSLSTIHLGRVSRDDDRWSRLTLVYRHLAPRLTSPEMSSSYPQSPVSTGVDMPRRRLSSFSRRGSTSAPDPWDAHHVETPTSSTSRLHIVRLPPPTQEELAKVDREHTHLRRRSSGGSTKADALRMSFAQPIVPNPPSPGGPRRMHPSTLSAPLAPQQLYDLAMSSIYPRAAPDSGGAQPAVFNPLPSSHYLPFIVRSSEVTQLLTQGPPRRLWALIRQIYPQTLAEESNDPTRWPFSQLERWMFKVDRHEANDRLWVLKARKCISTRSEALWEKLKNALGVSPELDEEDETEEEEKLDVINFGKGHKPDGESAVDDDASDDLEELAEPISTLGMTGLLMEPIYPNADPPPIPPLPGSEEEQAAGAMEVIGEEDEEEKPSAADAAPEGAQEATPKPNADQEPLDTSRMVGLTIVSRSRRISIDHLDHTPMDSPASSSSPVHERAPGNPLFPRDFSTLSIGPTLPSRSVPFFSFIPFSRVFGNLISGVFSKASRAKFAFPLTCD